MNQPRADYLKGGVEYRSGDQFQYPWGIDWTRGSLTNGFPLMSRRRPVPKVARRMSRTDRTALARLNKKPEPHHPDQLALFGDEPSWPYRHYLSHEGKQL